MPSPPLCKSLGRHCSELAVTVRVSDVESESGTLQDASMTWITGHTERIEFDKPYIVDTDLRVDATIYVPCKHLRTADGKPAVRSDGKPTDVPSRRRDAVSCSAHGFTGSVGQVTGRRRGPARVKLDNGRFSLVYKGKRRQLDLRVKRSARRALPVLPADNPCIGAPCRTGDNKQGAACCRDLQLELVLPKTSRHQEALLRSRKSPYLCKVKREDDDTVECEVISTCGYLEDNGVGCSLHDRILPNGRRAKPSLCYEWPDFGPDETGHPGCRLI